MWKFAAYESADGWRWRLLAGNGQVVATSHERFANKSNAVRAAENVKANAGSATVDGVNVSALAALFQ